jgi:hypothetical protein
MYINQISCNQEQNIYTVSVVLNFFYKFVFIFVMASHLTVIVRLRIGHLYTCIRTAFNVKNCIFHFKVACQTIMDRLEPYCNANPKGSWDSWVSYENIEV